MSQYEYKVITAPTTLYEYRVVPAPSKGVKRGELKTPEERFSHAIQESLNTVAAEGWEYVRAELLPSEERQGLTSTHTVYRSLLVFRRVIQATQETVAPIELDTPKAPTIGNTETPIQESPPEEAPTHDTPAQNAPAQDSPAEDPPKAPAQEPLSAHPKRTSNAPPVFLRAKVDRK